MSINEQLIWHSTRDLLPGFDRHVLLYTDSLSIGCLRRSPLEWRGFGGAMISANLDLVSHWAELPIGPSKGISR